MLCMYICIYMYACTCTYKEFVHTQVDFRHKKSLYGCYPEGCINVCGCKH